MSSLSIQAKLKIIILCISVAAVLLACGTFLVYDLHRMRETMAENLHIMAGIVGGSSTGAITFDDSKAANENLNALRADPHIVEAEISKADGKVFASYNRGANRVEPPPASFEFTSSALVLPRAIELDHQQIGRVKIVSDLEELRRRVTGYILIVGLALFLSAAAAFFLSAKLQGFISEPILALARAAREVSSQKNYSIRLKQETADEVGHLVEDFNGMLEQIQVRDLELQSTNRALALRNEENEMFVYSVSHDLRGPLVNLQGFSKELGLICPDIRAVIEQAQMPEEQRKKGLDLIDQDVGESLRFIQAAVMRLSGLIDAMLRLSRAGRVVYQSQWVDVEAASRRIADSLASTIAQKNATVKVLPMPSAWGDPSAVEAIFANLISNSLKYSDPKKPCEIEVGVADRLPPAPVTPVGDARHVVATRKPGDLVTYYVRDNGLGIPAKHSEKLFRAFQRLHTGVAEGEGIGLALVRRTVERHGGQIWVESDEGKGSTFYFSLPRTSRDPDHN